MEVRGKTMFLLVLWVTSVVVVTIVGVALFIVGAFDDHLKVFLGITFIVIGLAMALITFNKKDTMVETGYDEADYTYYLVDQNEGQKDLLYAVWKDDRLYYLYRDGKFVKDGSATTQAADIAYYEKDDSTKPYIEVHEIIHHIDEKVWFIKIGEKDVAEYKCVFHVPRGSIVGYYDLS